MTQDPFINRMMAETFEAEDSTARVRSSHPEQDFRLRRGLAKLPVQAFEGAWITPGLAHFSLHGHSIDLPMGHGPVVGWSKTEGEVIEHHAFLKVCGTLLDTQFSHVYVIQSEDEKPWLVFWDAREEQVDEWKLRELFRTAEEFSKAA